MAGTAGVLGLTGVGTTTLPPPKGFANAGGVEPGTGAPGVEPGTGVSTLPPFTGLPGLPGAATGGNGAMATPPSSGSGASTTAGVAGFAGAHPGSPAWQGPGDEVDNGDGMGATLRGAGFRINA